MKVFIHGLATGLGLQIALGPVFFFIANLTLRGTIFNGLAGVLAVTIVDYFYIALSILGVGKLLEHKKVNKTFGIVSSIVLAIFGISIIKGAFGGVSTTVDASSMNLMTSFVSVFLLTISSPMTILFFTSLFTAKAVEYNYKKKELVAFGLGTGFATVLFLGISTTILSLVKEDIPVVLVQVLNLTVGLLLIGYGGIRLIKNSRL